MLTPETLVHAGQDLKETDADDDDKESSDNLETVRQRLEETVNELLQLAEVRDHTERARVAALLDVGLDVDVHVDDDETSWAAPPELDTLARVKLLFLGQPRLLVIVSLSEAALTTSTAATKADVEAEAAAAAAAAAGAKRQMPTAAAQLYRIRELLVDSCDVVVQRMNREAPALAVPAPTTAAAAMPVLWPLQDKATVQTLGAKLLVGEDALGAKSILSALACPRLLCRCALLGAPTKGVSETLTMTANHYGGAVAFSLAWPQHYAGSLWIFVVVLLPLALLMSAWQGESLSAVVLTDATTGSREHVLWECLKLTTLVWVLLVGLTSWPARADIAGGMPLRDEQQVEGWSPGLGTAMSRALTLACAGAAVSLQWFLAQSVFVFIFWLEQHITFEWGDCIQLGCTDPAVKHGFLGWLAGIAPGILEAILLALLTELSKPLVSLLLWVRNYRLRRDRRTLHLVALVVMEVIQKVGTFGVLAFVFVPEWDDTLPGLPADFASLDSVQQRLARDAVDCSDLPDVALFGRGALLCLRRRLDANYRRWLFQKAMFGPFVVAPFLAVAMKVLLPILLEKLQVCFWRCSLKRRRSGEACCCSNPAAQFIVRVAGLIFSLEGNMVGCLRFLCQEPFQLPDAAQSEETHERPESEPTQGQGQGQSLGQSQQGQQGQEAEAAAEAEAAKPLKPVKLKPASQRQSQGKPRLALQALRQATLKPFAPENFLLDSLLSLLWVALFTPVWPWGCLPTLLARVLRSRADYAQLLVSRRRPFAAPPFTLQRVAKFFVIILAHLVALWHVALSTVTYNSRLSTATPSFILVVLLGWVAAVAVMWMLAVAILLIARGPAALQLGSPKGKPNIPQDAAEEASVGENALVI